MNAIYKFPGRRVVDLNLWDNSTQISAFNLCACFPCYFPFFTAVLIDTRSLYEMTARPNNGMQQIRNYCFAPSERRVRAARSLRLGAVRGMFHHLLLSMWALADHQDVSCPDAGALHRPVWHFGYLQGWQGTNQLITESNGTWGNRSAAAH